MASGDPVGRFGPPAPGLARVLGFFASLLIHVALGVGVAWVGSLPDTQLELQQPRQSQLGLTERVEVDIQEPEPSPPPTDPSAQPSPASQPTPPSPEKKPASRRNPKDAGPPRDAGPREATPDAGPSRVARRRPRTEPQLDAYAPKGTQLALRIDMEAIRGSPLASEAGALIEALPDWRALLDGSGIDAVEDLDKLLIASPDMRRAHVVVAGSFTGEPAMARRAVERLAEARQRDAQWRRVRGVRVAPWHDSDPTERILALVAPGRFTITRPEDLPRVIAISRALAKRAGHEGATDREAADSLLGMPEGVVLSVTVEGARAFLRGPSDAIPKRAEASLEQIAERRVVTRLRAEYDSAEQAKDALHFWEGLRSRYASHPLVSLLGMASALRESVLEQHEDELRGHGELTLRQLRLMLGTVRSFFAEPEPLPPPSPPPPPTPPARRPEPPRAADDQEG